MLRKGTRSHTGDAVTPDEEIKNPYVLEFLGLKDEYSETELEDALIGKLQSFLLELGADFTFVGRQHRLRVGDEWHWVVPGENPPIGLILCAEKDHAVAKYALEGLPNKVLAAEYRTTLPQERLLAEEIDKTRRQLDAQRQSRHQVRRPARR